VALRIEDYALIGDCESAALVGRDGSIDWLCWPRFDSDACFAALLGTPENGRWLIAPAGAVRRTRRRYRGDSLILETTFETDEGAVTLIDFMPVRSRFPDLIRIVRGERGTAPMHMQLVIRTGYGRIVPWVRRAEHGLHAVAGPDGLRLFTDAEVHGADLTTVADFTVAAGQQVHFALLYYPSHEHPPKAPQAETVLAETEKFWGEWAGHCTYDGPWRDAVMRSLITLKAMTYAPTGGIVAAATSSLPEDLGGVRNWDYRYCWLRDATFTLYALATAGYYEEARDWREWLLRAVAGNPSETQIMYGLAGERRLAEWEVAWLPGYESSKPVRVGNAASNQFQLDVFGEVLDAMYQCCRMGMKPGASAWGLERALVEFVETAWQRPDEGLWEVRGPRRHFTHSKMMAWVAVDRAVKFVENFGVEGPVERWRTLRGTIHAQVCSEGFNKKLGAFVQFYGSDELDASLLMMPLVGFLPADDPRVQGTVAAVQKYLVKDGFVARYANESGVDGLPGGEGAFLACTFWLADCLALMGRLDEARAIFERLLGLCNDVGLLSEEYDPARGRLVGNFPQAFSHVGLVNTATNLSRRGGPAEHRQQS
jgi:GH15 family glucan-1,4-alpha-glucosidase